MKSQIREFVPPILMRGIKRLRSRLTRPPLAQHGAKQNLDVYWDPQMAEVLDRWGEGNAWNDIQLLMAGLSGKVLDIACGTGRTMEILAGNTAIELYGCDISDMLLEKAVGRGIDRSRLKVTDATTMDYADQSFDWAYSIGSLEHFTSAGIEKFLKECRRVVRHGSFHMIPISRTDQDEGWITHG